MRAALILGLLAATPAAAQAGQDSPDPPACPAPSTKLPPELAGWTAMTPITAARTVQELGLATFPVGQSVRATLSGSADLVFPVAPAHPAAVGTRGGLFGFAASEGGTYRVALGARAWVDVVANGKAFAASAHRHGPDCSGVAKMVDFALPPGRYILQVSGSESASLPLMVTRLPA